MIKLAIGTVLLIVVLGAVAGCSGAHEVTPEELATVEGLRADLEGLRRDISAARVESDTYAGGLIKTLIETRIGILSTTEALIEQRIHGLESGAPVDIRIAATEPDTVRARSLLREIGDLTADIEDSRREANRYSGGLVHAMAMSTVATQEQTLAMLEQAYLSSKYGLSFAIAPASEGTMASLPVESHAPVASRPTSSPEPAKTFEIIDVDSRVTESNSTWSKFAWKLTVKNLTGSAIALNATIEFKDADGFVVDDDTEYGLGLQPHEERTFTGYDLIDASVARSVAQIGAKVGQR